MAGGQEQQPLLDKGLTYSVQTLTEVHLLSIATLLFCLIEAKILPIDQVSEPRPEDDRPVPVAHDAARAASCVGIVSGTCAR